MSVRMALAKLCACACGGAIIGGGAVHVAERPKRTIQAKTMTKRVVPRQIGAVARPRIRRVVTTRTTACAPAMVTVANAPPVPVGFADPFVGGAGSPTAVPVNNGGG